MAVDIQTRSVGADTANGVVDLTSLIFEIQAKEAIITSMVNGAYIDVLDDVINIHFKAALSPAEVVALDEVLLAHQGIPTVIESPVQKVSLQGVNVAGGRLDTSTFKTSASRVNFFTHDFTDPTTWYMKSVRIEDHAMTLNSSLGDRFYDIDRASLGLDSDDQTVHLIDVGRAKIFGERQLRDDLGQTYAPVVKVDGVEMKEKTLHNATNWDYELGYCDVPATNDNAEECAGRISFRRAPPQGSVVTMTFHYATTSEFIIRPSPGKKLELDSVEIQFASNVSIKDTMTFQPMGHFGALTPDQQALVLAASGLPPGFPLPFDTPVPYGTPTEYNGMRDFIREANGNYPAIPRSEAPRNEITARDLRYDAITFPWNYQSVITVSSLAGMYISIRLLHDIPYYGEFGDATFYCFSEDDTLPG